MQPTCRWFCRIHRSGIRYTQRSGRILLLMNPKLLYQKYYVRKTTIIRVLIVIACNEALSLKENKTMRLNPSICASYLLYSLRISSSKFYYRSLRYNAPVIDVISWRAGNTLVLMTVAWIVSGILGLALGIVAGVKRDSIIDRAVKAYCFILAATPTFWLGLLFLMVFAVALGRFPIGFSAPIGQLASEVTVLDLAYHMVLPAVTLSVVGVAQIALHTREKTIDVMESDYARFAKARGLSVWEIVRRHGLRNLALPAITLQFASIAEIFGGSVLVEQVFSYPGLGQAAVTAALGGDAALLCAVAVLSSAFVFASNLIANILYGVVDPRIRAGEVAPRG